MPCPSPQPPLSEHWPLLQRQQMLRWFLLRQGCPLLSLWGRNACGGRSGCGGEYSRMWRPFLRSCFVDATTSEGIQNRSRIRRCAGFTRATCALFRETSEYVLDPTSLTAELPDDDIGSPRTWHLRGTVGTMSSDAPYSELNLCARAAISSEVKG